MQREAGDPMVHRLAQEKDSGRWGYEDGAGVGQARVGEDSAISVQGSSGENKENQPIVH